MFDQAIIQVIARNSTRKLHANKGDTMTDKFKIDIMKDAPKINWSAYDGAHHARPFHKVTTYVYGSSSHWTAEVSFFSDRFRIVPKDEQKNQRGYVKTTWSTWQEARKACETFLEVQKTVIWKRVKAYNDEIAAKNELKILHREAECDSTVEANHQMLLLLDELPEGPLTDLIFQRNDMKAALQLYRLLNGEAQ
jgi:hypothetical protein